MSGPIKFSNFTADHIREHFFLSARHTLETAAIRYLFAIMQDELRTNNNKAVNNFQVGKVVIEKIEFRFDLFKEYAEKFFSAGYKPDMQALVLAVICDEYINHAAPPENDKGFIPLPIHNHFDHGLARRAMAIWNKAIEIQSIGIPEDEPLLQESLLLAHINAMEYLLELEHTIDDYDAGDLAEILKNSVDHMTTYTANHTNIGAVLAEFTETVRTQIKEATGEMPAKKPSRPALRLIKCDDAAP